ncbi:MAG TPA: hypothetical protein VLY83_02700 [Methanoregula sp.]|nr:hypothetical protein [Methanoregula sp.]
MKITKDWDWIVMDIGFWMGVLVISLINIGLIVLNRNQLEYDIYLLAVAGIAAFALTVVKSRKAKGQT